MLYSIITLNKEGKLAALEEHSSSCTLIVIGRYKTTSLPKLHIRAVANDRVGQVLARPSAIFALEETTPKNLTFASVLSFAKGPMFIVLWYLLNFLKKKRGRCGVYNNRDDSH